MLPVDGCLLLPPTSRCRRRSPPLLPLLAPADSDEDEEEGEEEDEGGEEGEEEEEGEEGGEGSLGSRLAASWRHLQHLGLRDVSIAPSLQRALPSLPCLTSLHVAPRENGRSMVEVAQLCRGLQVRPFAAACCVLLRMPPASAWWLLN